MKNKVMVLLGFVVICIPALSYAQGEFDDYEETTSFGEQTKLLTCHMLEPYSEKRSHIGRKYRITLREYVKSMVVKITAPKPRKAIGVVADTEKPAPATPIKKISTKNERIVQLIEEINVANTGVLRLSEVTSQLSIKCPERVKAGSPVTVKIVGNGDVDSEWEFGIMERGGAICSSQTIKLGRKLAGSDAQIKEISYPTYRGEVGKLLGVRVRRIGVLGSEHIFWVELIN